MPWDVAELEAQDEEFETSGVADRRLSLFSAPLSGSVLEVGAGIGATWKSGAYNDSTRFPRVVISEPDDALRKKLEERIKESGKKEESGSDYIEVVKAKLPQLPFEDEEFDIVGIFFVLSHMSGRDDCVKELVRVVKKGGVVVVMDHGLHYMDHSGHVKEFVNAPPENLDLEKLEKHKHHHGHTHSGTFDQPATDVVKLFQANDNLELRGNYEEFEAVSKRVGKLQCIKAMFLRK